MATFEAYEHKDGTISYYVKYRDEDAKKFCRTFYAHELEPAKAFFKSVDIDYPRQCRPKTETERKNSEARKRAGWINGRPPSEHRIWQIRKPDTGRCAICDCKLSEDWDNRVLETRTTGVQFKEQEWAYCKPCWDRHVELCQADFDWKALCESGMGIKLMGVA